MPTTATGEDVLKLSVPELEERIEALSAELALLRRALKIAREMAELKGEK